MSDEKPWLETTRADGVRERIQIGTFVTHATRHDVLDDAGRRVVRGVDTWARAKLIAAAPQLARALALAEVADGYFVCPVCDASYDDWLYRDWPHRPRLNVRHATGCSVDAALTAAGLVTQEQREEARRREQ